MQVKRLQLSPWPGMPRLYGYRSVIAWASHILRILQSLDDLRNPNLRYNWMLRSDVSLPYEPLYGRM